jgi:drug/metabolite transporter (DMT)-like permease
MNTRAMRSDLLLLLTSCIWGFGFVAQRSGMEYVGPFTFNGIRFILGGLTLIPLLCCRQGRAKSGGKTGGGKGFFRYTLAAGTCLFVAVAIQQLGIMFTTAGNAGFITGLYVILTPLFGIFLGNKTGPFTWLGTVFTLAGMYFISGAGSRGGVNPGDIIIAVSAIFWAFHVLLIDRLVRRIDPVLLSAGQFGWCGLFSLAAAFLVEPAIADVVSRLSPALASSGLTAWQDLPSLIRSLGKAPPPLAALIPLLYGGIASAGVAYTLQAVAQRDAPPAHATIILCLEGSFAALGGILILKEPLETHTILGFALMLGGMLVTQWEVIAGGPKRIR